MSTYKRLATASLLEVIPKIQANWDVSKPRMLIGDHSVGIYSIRMRTFGRDARASCGISCVGCGLEASFFAAEVFEQGNQDTAHANLYGIRDGEEVLFTHDHTLARALGGKDSLSNTKVMCFTCNNAKSKGEAKLAAQLGSHKKPVAKKRKKL